MKNFETYFWNSPIIMLLINPITGQIINANNASLKFYGYDYDEITMLNISDINVLPKEACLEQVDLIFNEKINHVRYRHKLKNSSIKEVEVKASPIEINNTIYNWALIEDVTDEISHFNKLSNFLKISDEIESTETLSNIDRRFKYQTISKYLSEKEKAEQELINSEQFYKSLFDTLNGFVYAKIIYKKGIAVDFEYIKANKAFEQQTGYKNVIGKKATEVIWDLISKDSLLIQKYADVAITGIPKKFETYQASTKQWYSISVSCPKKDYFIASFELITERKEKEFIISGLLNKYHFLLEAASDGIHIIDKDGFLIEANDSFCNMLGYHKNELLKLHISNWDVQWTGKEFKDIISEFIAKKNLFHTKHKRKDGKIIDVEIHSLGINLEGNEYLYASARDITERITIEAKIEEYTIKLKKANADLENFAFVASHDLKAPLNAINGFIGLLKSKNNALTEEKKEEYLEYIQKSTDQMKVLINDLLQYSRTGNDLTDIVNIDMNQLINEVQHTLSETIKQKNVSIQVKALPSIFGNRTLINELLMNLLGNALKYNNNYDSIKIEVGYSIEDNFYKFFIKDNGIGIAPDNLDKIFIMFKRLHTQSEYTGTGIGLSLCKKIVESHGGKIWVESKIGLGSTFYFTIKT